MSDGIPHNLNTIHGTTSTTPVVPPKVGKQAESTRTPPPDPATQQEKPTAQVANGAQQRSQEKGIPSETTEVISELIEYGHFEQAGEALDGGDTLPAKAFVTISELENIVSDHEKDPLDEALADLAKDGFFAPKTATKKMSVEELMQELGLAEEGSTGITNEVPDEKPSSNITPEMQKNFHAACESLEEPQKPTITKMTSEEADYLNEAQNMLKDSSAIGLKEGEEPFIDEDGYFNGEVYDEDWNIVRCEHDMDTGTYTVTITQKDEKTLDHIESFAKDGTMTTTTPNLKPETKQPDQHFKISKNEDGASNLQSIPESHAEMLEQAQSLYDNPSATEDSYINKEGLFIGSIFGKQDETITYSMDNDGNYIAKSNFQDGSTSITTIAKDGSKTIENTDLQGNTFVTRGKKTFIKIGDEEHTILKQEESPSGETLTEYLISTGSKGDKKVGRIYDFPDGRKVHRQARIYPNGNETRTMISQTKYNQEKDQWVIKNHREKTITVQTPIDTLVGMSRTKKGRKTPKYNVPPELNPGKKPMNRKQYMQLQSDLSKIAEENPTFYGDELIAEYLAQKK